jgi:hypothetical protein
LVKHIEDLPARGNFVIVKLSRTKRVERGTRMWVETSLGMRGTTPSNFVEILKANDSRYL